MTRNPDVREALDSDLDELVALWSHYIRGHRMNPAYGILPSDALQRRRESFERLVEGPDSTVYVATRKDGGLDGMISCFLEVNQPYLSPPLYARIQAAFVRPEARGRGNLKRLLRAATRWARGRGATEMRLYLTADNVVANALAEELGFEAIEVVRRRPLGRRTIPWAKASEDWETRSEDA